MKRLLMVMLSLGAMLGVWGETWTDPNTGYTWTYCINGDSAEISNGIVPKPTGSLTIPSTLGGKTVTSIGCGAFVGCNELTYVKIGNEVTNISMVAFANCYELKVVEIGVGMAEFGRYVFLGCSGLESFVVAADNPFYKSVSGLLLDKDGKTLVYGINGDVVIPDCVTNINADAFNYYTNLTSVVMPDGVMSIGALNMISSCHFGGIGWSLSFTAGSAFYGCSGIKNIVVSQFMLDCGIKAFFPSSYSYITSVTIPNREMNISASAFSGCVGIRTIAVPQYVIDYKIKNIFPYLYITNISYTSTITNIGDSAFSECSGLVCMTIPDTVTSIGNCAFERCNGLAIVKIPDCINSIGDGVFSGCSGLVDFTIPANVTNIGNSAFSGCSGLLTMMIPASVKRIGDSAFSGCSSLTSVTIPDGINTISDSMFSGCSGLEFLMIPNSVTNIGTSAFSGCSSLTGITIPYGVRSVRDSAFSDCRSLISVTIPNSVTNIADSAFYGCSGLTSVSIPNSIIEIGRRAFYGCSGLTSVKIPNGVTNIGREAFRGCSGLTSVTIPNSVTSIGSGAFQYCRDLTSITIPDSVTSLSTTAFDGCDKLWTSWYRTIANSSAAGGGIGGGTLAQVSLTVTNVVVHHVTASVQSGAVTPLTTTGIVNVIAEVGAGGAIAVPSEWANQYPGFATKFGSDFTAAVMKPTGKRDGSGNAMYVWQDFVAGTDPTDESDVFRASITFDGEGKPVISHSPELTPTEAAKRIYRTFGKVRLNDSDWTLVDGDAENYNFFKVTVEMR